MAISVNDSASVTLSVSIFETDRVSVSDSLTATESVALQITTTGPPLSDLFNTLSLSDFWTKLDPQGGGGDTISVNGTQLSIDCFAAFGDQDVNSFPDTSVRVQQPCANIDFAMTVKFDSILSTYLSYQGLTAIQDSANWFTFHFGTDAVFLYISADYNHSGTSTNEFSVTTALPVSGSSWLAVIRQGNKWTVFYSLDNITYTQAGSFTQALTISAVSLFGGRFNNSNNWTVLADYFLAGPSVPLVATTDSASVTESVSLSTSAVKLSVNDANAPTNEFTPLFITMFSAVSDNATTSESVSIIKISLASVSDSTSATLESVTLATGAIGLSVSDASTSAESISAALSAVQLSVSDAAASTESTTADIPVLLPAADAITAVEAIIISKGWTSSVFDAATAAENVQATVALSGSVFDSPAVSEFAAGIIGASLSVSDSPTATEAITATLPAAGTLAFDTSTSTEAVTLTASTGLSVSDSATGAETILRIASGFIGVFESATTDEAITATVPAVIFDFDAASLSDLFITSASDPQIFALESSTVSELSTVASPDAAASVSESSTATESLSILAPLVIAVNDLSAVSDATSALFGSTFALFESSIFTDFSTVSPPILTISLFESLTATDSVTALPSFSLSTIDTVAASEAFINGAEFSLNVSDASAVTEFSDVETGLFWPPDISDAAVTDESFTSGSGTVIFLWESPVHSEVVHVVPAALPPLTLSAFDSATSSESYIFFALHPPVIGPSTRVTVLPPINAAPAPLSPLNTAPVILESRVLG